MKRTTLFRILTLIYIGLVAWLCFSNMQSISQVPRTFWGIETDKLVHFAMFLPFPVLAFLCFRTDKMGIGAVVGLIVLIFAVGCLLAWSTEYVQGFLPYSTQDSVDWKADMIALAISSTVMFLISLICHACRKK